MENYNVAANGRFDGMTALITGGASGIGLAVAGRVIAEDRATKQSRIFRTSFWIASLSSQ